MSLPKIVATGPMDETAEAILAPFGPLFISPQTAADAFVPKLGQAVALLVRGEAQITADVIAAGPALKVIGRSGVGYNNVDVDAATARGIPLVYTPGAGARAVRTSPFHRFRPGAMTTETKGLNLAISCWNYLCEPPAPSRCGPALPS